MSSSRARTRHVFEALTSHPKLIFVIAIAAIALSAAGLTRLVKDTSVKAFIPDGHPALVADDKASEIFGLSDPLAIAIATSDGQSIFSRDALELIADLADRVAGLPNVRTDRIASLASESAIAGDGGEVFVEPYIDRTTTGAHAAAASHERWRRMPPHQGTLVSDDGHAAIIMAELIDVDAADVSYAAALELVREFEQPGLEFHVAGPAAVSGYLSKYIDKDARRLQPLVFVLVLAFIYLAFRRLQALPGPLFVVLGAAAGALGLMAWNGVSYFAITNALPVIIVAISVADAIHILSAYYQLREQHPQLDPRELVIRAMTMMARPVTLTTLTTIAGFIGIGAVSIMPPITWFAWYASLGVALAWVFSMVALPTMLLLIDPGRSPAFASWSSGRPSTTGRFLSFLGTFSPLRYRSVLLLFVMMTGAAIFGALQLRIDRSQVDNFAQDEAIRVADQFINENFSGSAFLDVVVEADQVEGLLNAERMRKIAGLQVFFESLPHVQKTVSIVDYLGLLHEAINGAPGYERVLPATDDAIAQYLLVYESSGDPTDFEEEIDSSYQTALVRGVLNEHHFSKNRIVVEALQDYIRSEFNEPGISASLSGNVNVSYHWMKSLQTSHFTGVLLSLALVVLTSVLVFRSLGAGVAAAVPVMFTVLVLYACMGYLDIYLEPATSMFAAIALGVGVDFGIHLVDRLRTALDDFDGDMARAINEALPPVARACFFNSAALGLGFSVLLVSDLPTLQRFGGLVALAAFSSYLAALVIVPALFALGHDWMGSPERAQPRRRAAIGILLLIFPLTMLPESGARATTNEALRIAEQVSARKEGDAAFRVITMTLTDRRGRERQRQALVHKLADDALRRTRITYIAPKTVRDVSFLSHDYRDSSKNDNRWLYIPATRKTRRVPASDRGDYFQGTDFTYEDMQSELKFDLDDYEFSYAGESLVDGRHHHRLSGIPRNEQTARQLGYGGFTAIVDETTWMPVRVEFFDLDRQPLKTITVSAIDDVSGIWTATDILAVNHQTGHQTHFHYDRVDYPDTLPTQLFDSQGLARGISGY